jgi:hypothetical protein
MDSLKTAVIKTLAYFDVFDYAPTLLDIDRWLLKTEVPHTLNDIKTILDADARVQNVEGFYVLSGRGQLAQLRKHKYTWTDEKWKRTQRYIRLLACMPYVESICLVNSMGWENARAASDIDVLIVATPGHIWSARFWTTALMKILRQRPHEQSQDRAVCLSLYVAADQLNLQPYRLGNDDIHYTVWVNQCYPVFDSGRYTQYTQENRWVDATFSHLRWSQGSERRAITLTRTQKILKRLLRLICNERLFKSIQWRIMPEGLRTLANTDQRVVMNEAILKLHTNDTREQRQEMWEQRVQQLEHL